MFALCQDVNLNAVVIKLRLIIDLDLFQRRISTRLPVPCLQSNKLMTFYHKASSLKNP